MRLNVPPAKLQWFNARELRSDKIHHHCQLLTSRLQHQRAVNVMNTDRLLLLQIDKLIERQSLQIWITTTFNDNNPLQLLPFASTGKHFFSVCRFTRLRISSRDQFIIRIKFHVVFFCQCSILSTASFNSSLFCSLSENLILFAYILQFERTQSVNQQQQKTRIELIV